MLNSRILDADSGGYARPILASTVYSAVYTQSPGGARKRRKLSTGIAALDCNVLDGGLNYGRGGLIALSESRASHDASVTSELTYNALADHLIANPRSLAFYVDTSTHFSARHLQLRLIASSRQCAVGETASSVAANGNTASDSAVVATALERVEILRVFDFAGLMEAVAEVGEKVARTRWKVGLHDPPKQSVPRSKTEIADSQVEEGESLEPLTLPQGGTSSERFPSCNEEILERDLNIQSVATETADQSRPNLSRSWIDAQKMEDKSELQETPSLLILNNLPSVLSPLMRNDYVAGHGLLVPLMRTLQQLTLTYSLCCIILNTTVDPNSGPTRRTRLGIEQEAPSAFSDVTERPALGKTFAGAVDLSIMVSWTVQSERSAQKIEGQDRLSRAVGRGERASVAIIEVLTDRYSTRAGKWAALERSAAHDGELHEVM